MAQLSIQYPASGTEKQCILLPGLEIPPAEMFVKLVHRLLPPQSSAHPAPTEETCPVSLSSPHLPCNKVNKHAWAHTFLK